MAPRSREKLKSRRLRRAPMAADIARTIPVRRMASSLVGHVAFCNSPTMSLMNWTGRTPRPLPRVNIRLVACLGVLGGNRLPHFSVKLVRATPGTVFPQFQTLRVVPTILFGVVCPAPTLATRQCNNGTHVTFSSHCLFGYLRDHSRTDSSTTLTYGEPDSLLQG